MVSSDVKFPLQNDTDQAKLSSYYYVDYFAMMLSIGRLSR